MSGYSDLYELTGTIDGDYFTENGITELRNPVLRLYDEDSDEISSASASPSVATGAASMSGTIRGTDPVRATLTWTATYTNNTTGPVSQDVALP